MSATRLESSQRVSLKVDPTFRKSSLILLVVLAYVIVPVRAFLRQLINLRVPVGIKILLFIRLNRETIFDLKFWLTFLEACNGRSFFSEYAKLHLYTDAAGSLGYSAVFSSHWFYSKWPDSWIGTNIIILENFLK